MPLPEAALAFSAFSGVLLFYPLAAEPREVAVARIALLQFVPPDTALRLAARPTLYGWMDDGRLTPQLAQVTGRCGLQRCMVDDQRVGVRYEAVYAPAPWATWGLIVTSNPR